MFFLISLYYKLTVILAWVMHAIITKMFLTYVFLFVIMVC